jgi:chromosome partitioning protein
MKVISTLSLAGGQGKTTLIILLAKQLSKQGKRVLVIDADPQANLTFFLGQEPTEQDPTLLEVLKGIIETEDGIYPSSDENLFIIPSDRSLASVSEYLSSSGTGAFVLKIRLKSVAELFDYVLVDVQPSRSQISLTAVGATELALIPAETTTKGVNSLFDTLSFLENQKQLMAFNGEVLGVIPFRDRWVGLNQSKDSRESVEAMKEIAEGITIFPSIRESEKFKTAIRQNQTLTQLGFPDLDYPFKEIARVLEENHE